MSMLAMKQDRLQGVATRLHTLSPSTYIEDDGSVQVTLSRGTSVQRFYGREELEISADAIDLKRVKAGCAPLLDSHRQDTIFAAVGRIDSAWVEKEGTPRAALVGQLAFHETREGKIAQKMVARGEISAVSIGYQVKDWTIFDADGDEVDPRNVRWNDEGLTFSASSWELLEASLCAVPADAQAMMRKHGEHEYLPQAIEQVVERIQWRHRHVLASTDVPMPDYRIAHWSIFGRSSIGSEVRDIRARMLARHRMVTRQGSALW